MGKYKWLWHPAVDLMAIVESERIGYCLLYRCGNHDKDEPLICGPLWFLKENAGWVEIGEI
jgi:hypothetical protein